MLSLVIDFWGVVRKTNTQTNSGENLPPSPGTAVGVGSYPDDLYHFSTS